MKISGIYQIQSIIKPERCYIGSAIDMKSRWRSHKFELNHQKHGNSKLQRHCDKYGESDLIFIIIEPCFPEFLIIREQFYIDTLNPFFNCCKTAGSRLGMKHSDSVIIKIKEARARQVNTRKGIPQSEEAKALLREARKRQISPWPKGSKHSEKTKKRFSEWQIGKKLSEQTKHKISIAGKGRTSELKGRKLSEEVKQKMSVAHKGLNTWMKGRPCPESVKIKLREFYRNKKAG
jgi:group I intron endonuclease